MEARATAKYVRVTPRKADQVLDLIRGKRVDQATELLEYTPKHVARVIGKVLHSAVANAVAMEGKIKIEELRVKHAFAGAGPTLKRFLPRAQGRATPLLKRTSHITVVVEGEALIEDTAPARRAQRTKAAAPKKAAPAPAEKAAKAAKAEKPAKAAAGAKKPARKSASKKSKEA
jgi:large subunit ribosomal protein L22